MFPERRLRRLRKTQAMSDLFTKPDLSTTNLIAPLCVSDEPDAPRPVQGMDGVSVHSLESILAEVRELIDVGVTAVFIHAISNERDETATKASAPDAIAQRCLTAMRESFGDAVTLISDVNLNSYTTDGRSGIFNRDGDTDNDATLEVLASIGVAQAVAGAHLLAPTGMFDGQVAVLRAALDEEAYDDVGILAYSAVFQEPTFGATNELTFASNLTLSPQDNYQLQPYEKRSALAEVALDIAEGADAVAIKPAMHYLDVISEVNEAVDVPVVAHQSDFDYAVVQTALNDGWLNNHEALIQQLHCMKRAGATTVTTRGAKLLAQLINN